MKWRCFKVALSDAQRLAVELLVEGKLKKGVIAKKCNVSNQALSYWQRNPDFRKELLDAQREQEEVIKTRRLKKARNIADKGLVELERRFRPEDIKFEKTKDIIAVLKDMKEMIKEDLGITGVKTQENPEAAIQGRETESQINERMTEDGKIRKGIVKLLKSSS